MDRRDTNWCLITGTTSSGKTTLCESLSGRGAMVTPEVTRLLFSSLMERGVTRERLEANDHEVRNLVLDHVLLLHERLAAASSATIFFDRGLIDQFAFFGISGIADSSRIVREATTVRYQHVFVLEPLQFVPDGIRTEDPERRRRLHDLILKYSEALGYDPILVPALAPDDRVEFVLRAMGQLRPTGSHQRVADAVDAMRRSVESLDPRSILRLGCPTSS
ncbi:ATP/GTP-binding protein [Rubricoccus marinus]|uniref:ATP/GTP-binding protein n=1 Tax=Rubricoccus marinus TaxID=716817 RepID=UPI001C527421|nr:ATP-binding protein [Rubricoccus marinus]